MNQNLASFTTADLSTSKHYQDGRFFNEQTIESGGLTKTLAIIIRYLRETKIDATPVDALPMERLTAMQLQALPDNEITVIKLGHSSVLLKVYREYWLIDPVFAERASPFSFLGPKRFQPTPIDIAELPDIERVLISHNHYDHLDKAAMKKLASKTKQFLVPLGVDSDLVKWGIPQDKIISFDWWQEINTDNALIAFTPTRHFSGRALNDANKSLWGSWVIKTTEQSLYFSGDSGYFSGFKAIGNKYGPFDLTLIETGAYDKDWPDVHMTPEQSVQAHIDLKGKVMMPIHNGTFDLAFHAWYEPLVRVYHAARAQQVRLSTPVVGAVNSLSKMPLNEPWWQPYTRQQQTAAL